MLVAEATVETSMCICSSSNRKLNVTLPRDFSYLVLVSVRRNLGNENDTEDGCAGHKDEDREDNAIPLWIGLNEKNGWDTNYKYLKEACHCYANNPLLSLNLDQFPGLG